MRVLFWVANLGIAVLVISGADHGKERADRIIINKARRELLLFHQGKVIRTYRVALGANPVGPKQQEGDGKTPEGNYTISGRNPTSQFHKSLRISYPRWNEKAGSDGMR